MTSRLTAVSYRLLILNVAYGAGLSSVDGLKNLVMNIYHQSAFMFQARLGTDAIFGTLSRSGLFRFENYVNGINGGVFLLKKKSNNC